MDYCRPRDAPLKNTTPGPSQEGNTIRVEMRKEGDACILIVSDNGVGLPPGFDIQTSQTLGMSLVRSWAVHQLRGTLEVDVQKGTKFIMTSSGKQAGVIMFVVLPSGRSFAS